MGLLFNQKVVHEKHELIMKQDHSVHNKTVKLIHTKILGLTVRKRKVMSLKPHVPDQDNPE